MSENRTPRFPAGLSALGLGLLIALAGSYVDNAFGGSSAVDVLQIALWVIGGALMLSGLLSTVRGVERHRTPRGRGVTA